MKIVNLQCPNCGARLIIENDMYVCNSCGTTIAIDYDDSDVEYEKAKNEVELEAQRQAHEKELLERKFELEQKAQIETEKRQIKRERQKAMSASAKRTMSSLLGLLFIAAIFFGIFKLYQFMKNNYGENGGYGSRSIFATPTPVPNYDPTPDDFKNQIDDFIASGKKIQMEINECAIWNGKGAVKNYDKKDAVIVDAYIITDIPEKERSESNRLVLIYEVTWHNEDLGDHKCYDAVYFEGIRVNPNGDGVISDFNGETIQRSDAAWGWMMAYSFEEYDQCYRENVTALGGKVTKIDYVSSEASDVTEGTTETSETSETTKATKATKSTKKTKKKKSK